MDTRETRPRARIGFMRRAATPAARPASVDAGRTVSPVENTAAVPTADLLRDHAAMLRSQNGQAQLAAPRRTPNTSDLEAEANADIENPEIDDSVQTLVPRSIVRSEPLPSEGLLMRLFTASRIARYRRPRRSKLLGRHEDISV